MSCGVYKITNKLTGECYVGSSKDIKLRWQCHKKPSSWKKQPNSMLYQDFQKYGLDKFTIEVIEECDKADLRIREDYYIQELKPSYNIIRAYNPDYNKQHYWNCLDYYQQWYQTHKEQKIKYVQQYHKTHKEKANEAAKRWNKNHSYYHKKWCESHKEQLHEYRRQYYLKRKAAKQVEPTK